MKYNLILLDMDTTAIIELISTVGFPIVVCGALFYVLVKQGKKNQSTIKALSETIQGNTKVLSELYTLIKESRRND